MNDDVAKGSRNVGAIVDSVAVARGSIHDSAEAARVTMGAKRVSKFSPKVDRKTTVPGGKRAKIAMTTINCKMSVKVGSKFIKLDDIGTRLYEFTKAEIETMGTMITALYHRFSPLYEPRDRDCFPESLPIPSKSSPASALYFLAAGRNAAHSEESFQSFLRGRRGSHLTFVLDTNNFDDEMKNLLGVDEKQLDFSWVDALAEPPTLQEALGSFDVKVYSLLLQAFRVNLVKFISPFT
jgi:hypothetical protein